MTDFRTVLRGYDPAQVDATITSLTQRNSQLQAAYEEAKDTTGRNEAILRDRAAEAERLLKQTRTQLADTQARLQAAHAKEEERAKEDTSATAKPWAALGEFAQKTEDEARARAERILNDAQGHADGITRDAKASAERLTADATARAKRTQEATERECAALTADAHTQADATVAAAQATAKDLRERAERDAEAMVRAATEEAERQTRLTADMRERYGAIVRQVEALWRLVSAPVERPSAPSRPVSGTTGGDGDGGVARGVHAADPAKPTTGNATGNPTAATTATTAARHATGTRTVRPVRPTAASRVGDPDATISMEPIKAPLAKDKPATTGGKDTK